MRPHIPVILQRQADVDTVAGANGAVDVGEVLPQASAPPPPPGTPLWVEPAAA